MPRKLLSQQNQKQKIKENGSVQTDTDKDMT